MTRAATAAATKEKVLAAARELFITSKYDEVKAADVARAAGVAHGLVFHHFGSKQGLYSEVLCSIGREVLDLHVDDPDVPLGKRIRRSHAAHLTYLAAHRDLALNLVLRPWGAEEPFDAVRDDGNRKLCENLGLDFERPAVRAALRMYTTAADQLARDYLLSEHPFDVDLVVEMLMAVLAGALRAARVADPSLEVEQVLEELARP
ncbi:TetR/AcrR family transcriptional regulator [Lentzea flaviverrucosa]|uniref:Transcriptional regulator, TetR family n=1 Tax=Lentzea flaviverrucosa TaxID=200379 RepID=A0A1H9XU62_9PSEU|nr:TetR/AcrR family transcriptional regulator [Lentzea flaviverrucosa]RDI18866.1 TetR family transcriptional regulator [Lentzea flaviverrucosa]SES49700.1 transcriptional regulator, TetR family [Lentzea flaviverrucosa]